MINRKNLLGKVPEELGLKDAIHVAIVSLRAGSALQPGERFIMNKDGEAIAGDGKESCGAADPFLRKHIARGTCFWGLLDLDEVPNVRHEWQHPKHSFEPPKTEPYKSATLDEVAKELKISYEQVLEACEKCVETERPVPYYGELTIEEFAKVVEDGEIWEIWSEWADLSGHEFYNNGTECCPEYDYPEGFPFRFVKKPPDEAPATIKEFGE